MYDITTYKKELIKINRSILKKCFDFLESSARGGEETSYIIKDI